MDVTQPYEFIWFGAVDVTKPYAFIWFGAMDVSKPHKFMRFGAMDVTNTYEFIGFRVYQGIRYPRDPAGDARAWGKREAHDTKHVRIHHDIE